MDFAQLCYAGDGSSLYVTDHQLSDGLHNWFIQMFIQISPAISCSA